MFLSVIIPAFNEEENFKRGCLNQVGRYLRKQPFFWELILVDDGSTDKTAELLKNYSEQQPGCRYLRSLHQGKFGAIKKGIFIAKGKIVLFTDFDQSVDINHLSKALLAFEKKVDLVIGDRMLSGARKISESFFNELRSTVFSKLTKLLMNWEIKDTQCGFKAFRRPIARQLFNELQVHRFKEIKEPFMGAADVELLFLARKRGFKIVSIPVSWKRIKSNRLTLKEPFLMLTAVFKIKLFSLLGYYNKR